MGGGLSAIKNHGVWFEVYFDEAKEAYERFEQTGGEKAIFVKRFLEGYVIKSLGINATTGEVSDELFTFKINGMYIGQGNFYVFYSTLDGTLPGRIADPAPDKTEFIARIVEADITDFTFIPIQPITVGKTKYLPYFEKKNRAY